MVGRVGGVRVVGCRLEGAGRGLRVARREVRVLRVYTCACVRLDRVAQAHLRFQDREEGHQCGVVVLARLFLCEELSTLAVVCSVCGERTRTHLHLQVHLFPEGQQLRQ